MAVEVLNSATSPALKRMPLPQGIGVHGTVSSPSGVLLPGNTPELSMPHSSWQSLLGTGMKELSRIDDLHKSLKVSASRSSTRSVSQLLSLQTLAYQLTSSVEIVTKISDTITHSVRKLQSGSNS
jgi:hypothetical protein